LRDPLRTLRPQKFVTNTLVFGTNEKLGYGVVCGDTNCDEQQVEIVLYYDPNYRYVGVKQILRFGVSYA